MAFPTTSILDAFNRANETPIAAPWTASAYWWGDPLNLVSNAVANSDLVGPAFASGSYWTTAQYGPDFEAFFTVSALSPIDTGTFGMDLALSGSDLDTGPATLFEVIFTRTSGTTYSCAISYWLADVFQFDIVNFSLTLAPGDQLGVRRVGDTWTVFQNGTAVRSGASSAQYVALTFSLFVNEQQASSTTRLDDFGGGTLTTFSTLSRGYPTQASTADNVVGPSPTNSWQPAQWQERVQTWLLADTKTNGGVATDLQYNTNQQGDWDHRLLRFMTRPLAAQVVGGTIDLCAYVQAVWIDPVLSPSNDSHVRFRLAVYITNGQTAVQKTQILNHTDTVDWPGVGAAAWRSLAAAQTLTAAELEDGDSIMVEFGLRVVSSPTPPPNYPPPASIGNNYTSAPFRFLGTTNSSNVNLTDATAGSTTQALAPWIEFSQPLVQLPAGSAPANDACVDAVVIAALPYKSPRISTSYSAGTQKEVWYTHTFAASGRFILNAFGSNYLVQLDAGKGASCGAVSFQLPVERLERLVGTTQSVGIWEVTAGETWWFRIRNKVPTSTDSGARESGGSLQIAVCMVQEPQTDDLILPCGNLAVYREGQLVALTAAFFSQFPTGVAIDYTERPMDDLNGGTNTNWRVLVGLFGSDIVEILDLPTLNVGQSEVDFIDDPLQTPISPGVFVRKHPSQLAISAAGKLYVGFFGNGFLFIDGFGTSVPAQLNTVASNASLYGGLRVLEATDGDNQPGAPFTAQVITGTSEVTNPWAIALQGPSGSTLYYTSGSLYLPVGGTQVRRLSTSGVQGALFATLTPTPSTNPGARGMYVFADGSALVCNGTTVQRFTAAGVLAGTFTPSVPELSRVLMDVKVTADGLSAWAVDLGTNTLWKFLLADMSEVAYYETDLLPGTLTQMAIVQPVAPSPECPGRRVGTQIGA